MSANVPTTAARRWPHFSLRQLLLATAVCALAATLLAVGSDFAWHLATTSLIGLNLFAVVAAFLLRAGAWRGFWLGFACFAWFFALPVFCDWAEFRQQLLPFRLSLLANHITELPAVRSRYGGHPGGSAAGEQANAVFEQVWQRNTNQVRILRVYTVLLAGLVGGAAGALLGAGARGAPHRVE